MTKFLPGIIAFLIIALPTSLSAADVRGKWKVAVPETIKYNSLSVGMNSLRLALLKCISEKTSLHIDSARIKEVIDVHECSHNNKAGLIEGEEHSYGYRILFSGHNQTAILNLKGSGDQYVEVVNWLGKDKFWIDLSEPDFRRRRIRYFFYRVPN
ncbi:MAG: hypothetical protein OIF38_01195 [Cellvibrionaceae bacterium]|nr:hypothetical protein [Cellvibrionaceae bacterium]